MLDTFGVAASGQNFKIDYRTENSYHNRKPQYITIIRYTEVVPH